jgi:hypothetical protein
VRAVLNQGRVNRDVGDGLMGMVVGGERPDLAEQSAWLGSGDSASGRAE